MIRILQRKDEKQKEFNRKRNDWIKNVWKKASTKSRINKGVENIRVIVQPNNGGIEFITPDIALSDMGKQICYKRSIYVIDAIQLISGTICVNVVAKLRN